MKTVAKVFASLETTPENDKRLEVKRMVEEKHE